MIQDKLKALPNDPGVYLMKNRLDQVIYVGKAKNLKNRVRQYFSNYGKSDAKVKAMVGHISDFEYIIVQNELESLILESNLIKEYLPKYNILLRDDKQYPYIKITVAESFPRVMKTRSIERDKAKYYGPFPNATAVNDAIEIFHEFFPLRNCKLNLEKNMNNFRPCLNYFIHKCSAPCINNISEEDYNKYISEIQSFLEGKDKNIINTLTMRMKSLSKDLAFEEAAKYRDKILALEALTEKQIITDASSREEYDIVNFARGNGNVCIQVFFYRNGKVLGREHFIIDDPYSEDAEDILQAFLIQFYKGTAYVPSKIFLPNYPNDHLLVEKILEKHQGRKTNLIVPQKGEKKKLLNLVKTNALDMLTKHMDDLLYKKSKLNNNLLSLKKLLNLQEIPERIEAFDISNISGVESVGSMVVFENGMAKKSDYRRFRIKTISGPNDYGSMKEVLSRRFLRGINEQIDKERTTSFSRFPDLILMDGGKGQVNIAKEVLYNLGIDLPVAGLVKDDKHRTRGIIFDNREENIEKNSELYRFIFQIQEEAHRFAINYHRSLRSKSVFLSELDGIENIGKKRKKDLMAFFKSIEKVKAASVEELLMVDSMNIKAAQSVYDHFRGGIDEK